MVQKGEVILYTTPDGESKIEVKLEGETVWLTAENWKKEQLLQKMQQLPQMGKHTRLLFTILT